MKNILISLCLIVSTLNASDLDGIYHTTFEEIEGIEWGLPGLAPWEEKIKIKGTSMTFFISSEPMKMEFERHGNFILGTAQEGDETYYFPIYISPDGNLHTQGKGFKKNHNQSGDDNSE